MRRTVYISLALGALGVRSLGAQSPARGSIVGIVSGKETGAPLPYADILVEGTRSPAFVDNEGRFRVSGLPTGEIRIRVRRVGFTPAIVAVNVHAGATDTVRVALAQIAIRLDRVSVRDKVCPGGGTNDTSVVAILQQVQMNAERAAMLAHQLPFNSWIERVVGDETALRAVIGERVAAHHIVMDTIWLPSEHDWQYEPGNLVSIPADQGRTGRAQMNVPQLIDFASERFVAAHCFRYAGLRDVDRRQLVQVDVEAAKEIKTPDVKGSLYLDPANYDIVRSSLYMEMASPVDLRDMWETHVDTWFREILPGLRVIDRVCMRMAVHTQRGYSPRASAEAQRLLELRFVNDAPPGFMPIAPAQVDSTRRTACPK